LHNVLHATGTLRFSAEFFGITMSYHLRYQW